MAQYFRQTVSPGASPTVTEALAQSVIANVSMRNISAVDATVETFGTNSDSFDLVPANSTALRYKVPFINLRVTGNGASVIIDVSGPDEYADPRFLATTGTSTVTVSGTVTTDIGVANSYAKDVTLTAGNLKVLSITNALPAGTNVLGVVKFVQPQTNVVAQSLAPTAIAESTVETVELTGSTTLALGQLVNFALSCAPTVPVAAAAIVVQYIALKGATSGLYYAVAYPGEAVFGSLPVQQAEKLNLVARNSSAATGINVSGFYQAMNT